VELDIDRFFEEGRVKARIRRTALGENEGERNGYMLHVVRGFFWADGLMVQRRQ